ncbi:MAG: hypothetical protein RLY86_818 [Pseudomonadota bacterium]|jgi:hypothetical protein
MPSLIPRPLRGAVFAFLLLFPAAAQAHEGHDHGDPRPASRATDTPVIAMEGSAVQMVAVPDGQGHLILYIDHLTTNEPVVEAVVEAVVEVAVDGGPAQAATPRPDGTFLLEAPWSVRPGNHQIVATVVAGDLADLLDGTLVVPEGAADADMPGTGHPAGASTGAVFLAGSAAGAAVLMGIVVLARRRRTVVVPLLALVLVTAAGDGVEAHEGHDHGAVDTRPAGGNAPQRLPDGSLWVPKATQRILDVRTSPAQPTAVPRTVTLPGRVIPDPNGTARVQATQTGLVEPPEGGLPLVGQRVEAGQILAYVTGAVGTVERGDVEERTADLDKQIQIARRRVERLSSLTGVVATREIEEAQADLTGLRRQRAALDPTLTRREAVRTPIAGIVSRTGVVPGQMIDDRDETVLFEIVDPARLLVEAVAFDPAVGRTVQGANAVAGGSAARLSFLAEAPVRRETAIPLLFRVEDGAAGLGVGTLVQVHAALGDGVTGITLPRAAILRGPDGLPMVWEQVAPLHFLPRHVRARPLDGETSLVEAGIEPGARIVVQGASLLAQVR